MTHFFARPAVAMLGAALFSAAALAQSPLTPPTEKVIQAKAPTCEDVSLSVYFSSYEAMLSNYAMRSVNAATDLLAGCAVTEIEAVVISEERHADEDLAALSEARAAAVLDAFASRGVHADEVHTIIPAAIDNTQVDAVATPLARRVDIRVKAEPGYGL